MGLKKANFWQWETAIAALCLLFLFVGIVILLSQGTDTPPPLVATEEKKVVNAIGEKGYEATEEFCRDSLTTVADANIPERNGFVLTREKGGVKETILVVIDPQTNNVLYATYDTKPSNPTNAVITSGARKCFQDKVGVK